MKGTRPLTDTEVEVIAQSFAGPYAARDKALFLLGCKSGFRISELLSLQVRDVYQHGRLGDYVTVRRGATKGKQEGRTVPLNPTAKVALAEWLQILQRDPRWQEDLPLFVSRKGAAAITRQQARWALKEAVATNKLSGKVATHSMRKTFLRKAWEIVGPDPFKLQKLSGHKHLNSLIAYLETMTDEEADEVVKAM